MLLAAAARFADYNFAYMLPRTETNYSYHDMQYVTMRTVPAFFATTVIPLSFFIVRTVGGTRLAAFCSGFFCLVDFLLVALARHIMTDGVVQFFVAMTVFFTTVSSHYREGSRDWWLFVSLASAFLGFTISSRIAAAGLWAFVLVWHRQNYFALSVNVIVPVVIFCFTFCGQVVMMPLHSEQDGILSESYRLLLAATITGYHLDHGTIVHRAFELIRQMFVLRGSLPVRSIKFQSWPLMTCKWRILWTQLGRTVAAFGNVVVWWPLTISLSLLLVQVCIARRLHRYSQLLAVGWLSSLLFFVCGVNDRGVCDYEIALLFGLWALPLFIDAEASELISGFVSTGLIVFAALLFVLWAPLVYGYENFDTRFAPYFAKPMTINTTL
jgi:dolichyl-phosphate-mannose--protein O-mannosyl transferase